MPDDGGMPDFANEEIQVCENTSLKLFSLYFDKENLTFSGSLKEDMKL
jgi:hypothetical protein